MLPACNELLGGGQRRNTNLIAVNDCNALGVNNAACIANSGVRRKSLSFQTSQQLAIKSNGDDAVTIESSAGRFSPHPNDIFSAQAAKLTIPLEKFDDLLVNSGCLPPPSPAPHSDSHMEMQTKLNSSNNQMQQLNLNQFQHHAHNHNHAHTHTHTQVFPLSSSNSASSLCTNNSSSTQAENTSSAEKHNKFMPHPRAISPNSKYRLERYREQTRPPSSNASSSNSTRYYMTSPKMVQCDAYGGYLGSTVHTPVKRYVPTPPPVDLIAAAASPTCTLSSSQYVNIPYGNYTRGKCTHEESQVPGAAPAIYSKSAQTYNIINMPSSSAAGTGTGTVQSLSCPCPFPSLSPAPIGSFSAPSTAASSSTTLVGRSATKINSYRSGTHSIEGSTAGIQRQYDEAAEPIILIQSESSQRQGTGQTAENSSTCLHCNTARRTTGVHQTTQTTGPISPVPAMTLTIPMKQQHEQQELMIALSPPATIELTSQQQQQQQQLQQATKLYSASNLSNLQIKTNHLQQQQQQQYQLQHQHQQQQQQQHQHQLQQQSLQTLSQQQQQQVQVQLQVQPQQQQQQQSHRYSCKKRIIIYLRREISRFFGVEPCTEAADFALWYERHRRLAIRCFGPFNSNSDNTEFSNNATMPTDNLNLCGEASGNFYATDRPDILPAQDAQIVNMEHFVNKLNNNSFNAGEFVERKATVVHMLMTTISYLINIFHKRPKCFYNNGNILKRRQRQWSRSFAPLHVQTDNGTEQQLDSDCSSIGIADSIAALIDGEVFFDNPCIEATNISDENTKQASASVNLGLGVGVGVASEATVGVYLTERHQGWRTSALHLLGDAHGTHHQANLHTHIVNVSRQSQNVQRTVHNSNSTANRGTRIVAQLLDGVLENSRRPQMRRIKYFSSTDLDDRTDHRPFFTYWINTVQIIVLFLSIICYGIAPIGFGTEQKTGQVLVTSLSLQTVQHVEQRNLWIGPRNNDLVHMGAKFAACMRRDVKIMEVVTKTRRQERETACCIRNDDSGCVQSSQADCSIRGLYPTKSISTWKKWSPGESGPGGRISGSVCGLDPKFCDAPASIVPYEWPDDITKWPICRKTNSFSQRYRYKDHTAEHMVCEVIGHPCCTGLYGECRITTREYCDFVNGYFHEEASLCSQISCLNNVCGMFPFISVEIPDQIYRLLTSLCMHAGILHLAITLIFQHLFLADLERLIGTCRTAVVYIMSGLVGNLTSAVLVPHRAEVGPSASLCGVVSSLVALLIWMHWKHLHKPYVALLKLLLLSTVLFAIGTLPYQLNFAELLAGVACGAFLTISLVPFASFSKYGRRKKINLIWMCIVFHLFVCATLIATFYIYPSEFGTFNFVDDVFGSNGNGKGFTSATNSNIGHYNGDVSSTTRRYSQTQKPQFYYHHHSEDIIRNTGAFTEENIISHIYPEAQRQKNVQLWQNDFYTRSHSYNSSSYSENIFKNKEKTSKTKILASDRKRNSKSNIAEVNYKSSANMNNTKFKGL